jgi:hypothetical protein
MLSLFISISLISLIKNTILTVDVPFIIYDFVKNICYANVYSLLIKYVILKDAFIIMFAPIIISDLLLSILYIYKYIIKEHLNIIKIILAVICLDLLKLSVISLMLFNEYKNR